MEIILITRNNLKNKNFRTNFSVLSYNRKKIFVQMFSCFYFSYGK